MKKLSIVIQGVIMAMSMVAVAHADSKPWSGFYAGAGVGLDVNQRKLQSQQLGFNSPSGTCNQNSDQTNLAPAVQWGYVYQFPNALVSGIEVYASVNANQKHKFNCRSQFNATIYDRIIFRNQQETSLKARVGRSLHWQGVSLLPYLTAGVSLANVGLAYENEGGDYYANTATQVGWLMGAGMEWVYAQHWSLRAEYNYVDDGRFQLRLPTVYGLNDPNGHASLDLSANNLAMSINYWF